MVVSLMTREQHGDSAATSTTEQVSSGPAPLPSELGKAYIYLTVISAYAQISFKASFYDTLSLSFHLMIKHYC